MQNISFKTASAADIPLICHFRKTQLLGNGAPATDVESIDPQLKAFFEERFRDGSIHQIFAMDGDRAVATGGVLFFTYPPSHVNKSGRIAYITNMFTAPEYRRQGIATAILAMLEDEARARGVSQAKLGATRWGRSVYEKAGYTEDNLSDLVKKL